MPGGTGRSLEVERLVGRVEVEEVDVGGVRVM